MLSMLPQMVVQSYKIMLDCKGVSVDYPIHATRWTLWLVGMPHDDYKMAHGTLIVWI